MMYGAPPSQQQQQQQQQQQPPLPPMPHPSSGGDFNRGLPMRQPSASSTTLSHEYSHHNPNPPPPSYEGHGDVHGRRIRKLVQRRAVDYTSTVVRYLQVRMWQRDVRDRTVLQPTPAAAVDMLPTVAYADNPSTSFASKFVHASTNKNRCSINRVLWFPTGRRLITGSHSGEFTLWNGQSFNFEMILQAHDQAIRSMVWSHNENWMVSGDDGGAIKYWQSNMNNVKANKSAHKESVRDLSFSRTDLKFCSCSDDTTVKVWDFARCQEEKSLTGHGWDVKCVDWHPSKSLLVSGGKDNLVKLWDAKSGRELCSFHGHKNTVLCAKWNQNGNWVLTASKDQIIKLYDIRAMKELESFRGHRKDVTALAWHPFHEEYFVSGSFDGSIFHWLVGHENPQVETSGAHETSVWDLAWHPIGYILCSGSNDHTTKFWCRNRPGDPFRERPNVGYNQGYADQNPLFVGRPAGGYPVAEMPTTPGLFSTARNEGTIPGIGAAMPLSMSIDGSDQGDRQAFSSILPSTAPPLPPGPHPSLLAPSQQQHFQVPTHQQPQQAYSQQMISLPLHPSNMPQLQAHMSIPHIPRPPPPQLAGSMPLPSSLAHSPNQMVIQGLANQMITPVGQGHVRGLNPMHTGNLLGNNITPGGSFTNGVSNIQVPNPSGVQNFQPGAMFNRPPGLNAYQLQSGMMEARPPAMGPSGSLGLPPPQLPRPSGPQ